MFQGKELTQAKTWGQKNVQDVGCAKQVERDHVWVEYRVL